MYIKPANTVELNNQFIEIWQPAWKEKNFTSEIFENAERFLVYNELSKKPTATFEISNYFYHEIVEMAYAFSEDERIKSLIRYPYYIDKLCIEPNSRGNIDNIGFIMYGIVSFALEKKEDVKFIALIQSELFSTLRTVFQLDLMNLGKNKLYKNEIPMFFDFEAHKEELVASEWYQKYHNQNLKILK